MMKFSADLFHTKRLFIAGTHVLLLCVDLILKPATPEAFLSGPNSLLPPPAAVMNGVGEEQDTFPRRPSVLLQVKQHSIQSCFTDISRQFRAKSEPETVWTISTTQQQMLEKIISIEQLMHKMTPRMFHM